jgi:hypothetical protein
VPFTLGGAATLLGDKNHQLCTFRDLYTCMCRIHLTHPGLIVLFRLWPSCVPVMATAASDSGVRSACAAIGAVAELMASPVAVSFDERPEPDDDLASNFTADGWCAAD